MSTENKLGIENTVELLKGLKLIGIMVMGIAADGKVNAKDLPYLIDLAKNYKVIVDAASDIDQVISEVKDLDQAEVLALIMEVMDTMKAIKDASKTV